MTSLDQSEAVAQPYDKDEAAVNMMAEREARVRSREEAAGEMEAKAASNWWGQSSPPWCYNYQRGLFSLVLDY